MEGEVSEFFWEISENLGEISQKIPRNFRKTDRIYWNLVKFSEITEILKSLKIQYNWKLLQFSNPTEIIPDNWNYWNLNYQPRSQLQSVVY